MAITPDKTAPENKNRRLWPARSSITAQEEPNDLMAWVSTTTSSGAGPTSEKKSRRLWPSKGSTTAQEESTDLLSWGSTMVGITTVVSKEKKKEGRKLLFSNASTIAQDEALNDFLCGFAGLLDFLPVSAEAGEQPCKTNKEKHVADFWARRDRTVFSSLEHRRKKEEEPEPELRQTRSFKPWRRGDGGQDGEGEGKKAATLAKRKRWFRSNKSSDQDQSAEDKTKISNKLTGESQRTNTVKSLVEDKQIEDNRDDSYILELLFGKGCEEEREDNNGETSRGGILRGAWSRKKNKEREEAAPIDREGGFAFLDHVWIDPLEEIASRSVYMPPQPRASELAGSNKNDVRGGIEVPIPKVSIFGATGAHAFRAASPRKETREESRDVAKDFYNQDEERQSDRRSNSPWFPFLRTEDKGAKENHHLSDVRPDDSMPVIDDDLSVGSDLINESQRQLYLAREQLEQTPSNMSSTPETLYNRKPIVEAREREGGARESNGSSGGVSLLKKTEGRLNKTEGWLGGFFLGRVRAKDVRRDTPTGRDAFIIEEREHYDTETHTVVSARSLDVHDLAKNVEANKGSIPDAADDPQSTTMDKKTIQERGQPQPPKEPRVSSGGLWDLFATDSLDTVHGPLQKPLTRLPVKIQPARKRNQSKDEHTVMAASWDSCDDSDGYSSFSGSSPFSLDSLDA